MKTAIFEKAGSMIIEEVDKPKIQASDDVILRIVRACVWLRFMVLFAWRCTGKSYQ